MFGSATCDYSAGVQPNFGKDSASLAALLSRYFAGIFLFCGPAGVNLNPLLIISYQLVTNLPVGIQLLDDDDNVQ